MGERFWVNIAIEDDAEAEKSMVPVSPELFSYLGLEQDRAFRLRFGTRWDEVRFRADHRVPSGDMRLPAKLIERLCLNSARRVTASRSGEEVVLGPLVGLLLSRRGLQSLLKGRRSPAIYRYKRYAEEVGALLFFFSMHCIDVREGVIRGYVPRCGSRGKIRWLERVFPVPRVIYDRAMRRREATQLRRLRRKLGFMVVNRRTKIRKLPSFGVLKEYPELSAYLPFTQALTVQSLKQALSQYTDLYLKPNGRSQGYGVCRLRRWDEGWLLRKDPSQSSRTVLLPDGTDIIGALSDMVNSAHPYLVQEGLPLATYFGNRFDFRSLVQKDGQGRWRIGGLVARIAPLDSVVTSPRSGGNVATPERVLRHAFPDRWRQVMAEIEVASFAIARRIDQRMGPCSELGIDLGVLQDGSVKLIEVNGKPLKVSLNRLRSLQVKERIYRYPIHYGASLDLTGVEPCRG